MSGQWNRPRRNVGVEHHNDADESGQDDAVPEDGFENSFLADNLRWRIRIGKAQHRSGEISARAFSLREIVRLLELANWPI